MKLNTSLFICILFSAIIAIEAAGGNYNEVYDSSENVANEYNSYEDEQGEAGNQLQEPEAATFQYKPSKRLENMENNMSDSAKELVENGKVKKTMTEKFASAMATDVAKTGFTDANHEWQLMLEGKEASRVFGTFGQNFNTIVTSADGADMINILATTVHVLLAKAGEEKMSSGLSDLVSMTYTLFTSPNMSDIINKTGGLVITAVNKPGAPLFVKTYWDEIKKLMADKNLNEKLKKYFFNISSMMKSLSGIMQGGKPLKRRHTIA